MAFRAPAGDDTLSTALAPTAPDPGVGSATRPRATAPVAPGRRNVWLAWLIYVHRWLGIAGCLLFIAWFISGIAMMYVRMPTVTPEERALHADKLDLTALAITPVQAAATAKARSAANAELGMLLGRPVYRFMGRAPVVVFADDGTRFASLSKDDAMRVAREWSPKTRRRCAMPSS